MKRKLLFFLILLFFTFSSIWSSKKDSNIKRFPRNFIKDLVEVQKRSYIELQPGLYSEEYIKINHPVEIIGESPGSVFVHSQNFVQIRTDADLILKNINFFIKGDNPLYKKGIAIYTKNGNVEIDNCSFSGFKIALEGLSKGFLTISNSNFNFNNTGISVVYSPALIENNIFTNHKFEAVILLNPDIVCRNNIISDNGTGIFIIPNKKLKSWDNDIVIESNEFSNNKRAGISIYYLHVFNVIPSVDLGGGAKASKGRNVFKKNKKYDIKLYTNKIIFAINNSFEGKSKSEIMKKIHIKNKGKIILTEGEE
jgi:hypothetical protein